MFISSNRLEVAIVFDTTGSMYPCLTQVRRRASETVRQLAKEIPGIRIAIGAHGDYCDKGSTYVTKWLNFTDDVDAVVRFIERVEASGGGDSPECYELVLHEAQQLPWTDGYDHALVMIGDDLPHEPGYKTYGMPEAVKIDWRIEAAKLKEKGIKLYSVQALNRSHAKRFWEQIAKLAGGWYLTLDQFSYATEMIMAICYQQHSSEQLEAYETKLASEGKMNRNLNTVFRALGSTAVTSVSAALTGHGDLRAVPPGRFQVLAVDKDSVIADFVKGQGVEFKAGRGFYQFMKTETIQGYKEIILMDKITGDLFYGDAVREMLGIDAGVSVRLKPKDLEKYHVFVQSTSYNRKLIGGYKFLYEVSDWDKAEAA